MELDLFVMKSISHLGHFRAIWSVWESDLESVWESDLESVGERLRECGRAIWSVCASGVLRNIDRPRGAARGAACLLYTSDAADD